MPLHGRQLVKNMNTANLIRALAACPNKETPYALHIKRELATRGVLA